MPDLPPPDRADYDPGAYTWPAWASNIRQSGTPSGHLGWSMEINGHFLKVPIFGYVSMNSLPELHRFALQIDVWDAEQVVRARRARLDDSTAASRAFVDHPCNRPE